MLEPEWQAAAAAGGVQTTTGIAPWASILTEHTYKDTYHTRPTCSTCTDCKHHLCCNIITQELHFNGNNAHPFHKNILFSIFHPKRARFDVDQVDQLGSRLKRLDDFWSKRVSLING